MTLDEHIQKAEEDAKMAEFDTEWGIGNYFIDRTEALEYAKECRQLAEWLKELKQLREQTIWIPVSERLPEDLEPVNITWVNRNPKSYYADIKDKPFTATGVYFNGQWYWWSTFCVDILGEYSHNYDDVIDDDIEITAWQSLPEPYKVR